MIGKERELLFNIRAMQDIKKKYGSLKGMQDAVVKAVELDAVDEVAAIITILANAAILRSNADIDLGFAQGEKDPLLTPEIVALYVDMDAIKDFPDILGEVLSHGYKSEIPKAEEEDLVLQELDAKNG